jgi:hypothetical protein
MEGSNWNPVVGRAGGGHCFAAVPAPPDMLHLLVLTASLSRDLQPNTSLKNLTGGACIEFKAEPWSRLLCSRAPTRWSTKNTTPAPRGQDARSLLSLF